MSTTLYIIITALIALGVGVYIGRVLLHQVFRKQQDAAREKAKLIIKEAELDAESIKKNRMYTEEQPDKRQVQLTKKPRKR